MLKIQPNQSLIISGKGQQMNNNSTANGQIFGPNNSATPSAINRTFLRNLLARTVVKLEIVKFPPGLLYYNYTESPVSEGKNWIEADELYNPANMFAILDAGYFNWGMKMHPERFKTGFEEHYLKYGSLFAEDSHETNDRNVYLIRFHNQRAFNEFRQTVWFKPLHTFSPTPLSKHIEDMFSDTDQAQMYGWRKQFEGSGFSDIEIKGTVEHHKDFEKMEMIFLGDITSLNIAYKHIGGKWQARWILRNLKEADE